MNMCSIKFFIDFKRHLAFRISLKQQNILYMTYFKNSYSFEDRKKIFKRLIGKDDHRIPVIVEKHFSCSDVGFLLKNKFVFDSESDCSLVMYKIRSYIPNITQDKALFFFVEDTQHASLLLHPNHVLSSVYEKHKDPDGFLYIQYTSESMFG